MKKYLLLLVSFYGCSASYSVTKTGAVTEITAKGPSCDFVIATTKLEKQYEEIGILDYQGHPAAVPDNAGAFKELIQEKVCEVGGDAVIAEINGWGQYMRGTVVRFKKEETTQPPVNSQPSQ